MGSSTSQYRAGSLSGQRCQCGQMEGRLSQCVESVQSGQRSHELRWWAVALVNIEEDL